MKLFVINCYRFLENVFNFYYIFMLFDLIILIYYYFLCLCFILKFVNLFEIF